MTLYPKNQMMKIIIQGNEFVFEKYSRADVTSQNKLVQNVSWEISWMLLVYRDLPGSGQIKNVIVYLRQHHMPFITSHSTLYATALRSNIFTEKLDEC